jgi:hypothetical protein
VLVSTEALVELLVALDALVSTDALADVPAPLDVLVSTEAVVEPVGRGLVSRAWAIPGRTPPRNAAVLRIARHERTHRRRRCRPLPLKNPLRPNDLSRSFTTDLQAQVRLRAFPFVAFTPSRRVETRAPEVMRNTTARTVLRLLAHRLR